MADVTIDGVVEDTEVTGGEKIPVSDGGIPKAVTTDRLKDFVLKRIAALASADKVDTASDGVYLLKGGELKPVSAAVLAAAVMDYAFALAPVEAITGNETVSIKDATVKKTLSLDMLKSWLTEGSVTAEDLKEVADSVANKVDKEEGKGLSEENFSAEDQTKLDSLVSNAQPDWEQTDDTDPSYIRNKPTIPESVVVDQVLDSKSVNPIANSVVALALEQLDVSALLDKVDESIRTSAKLVFFAEGLPPDGSAARIPFATFLIDNANHEDGSSWHLSINLGDEDNFNPRLITILG
jgi:hypothetical protein